MKITDLKVWVTVPERSKDSKPAGRSYVFLRIDTDEGISGFGEATSSGGGCSIVVGNMIEFLKNRDDLLEDLRKQETAQSELESLLNDHL